MKPANFRIEAEGHDITKLVNDRLLSLTIEDADGKESDSFTLTLDNRDDKLKFPKTGYKLRVWIGLGDQLVDKGSYTIDEISESIHDGEVEVSGKATDMGGPVKAPKTCTWEAPLSMGKLVATIASDNGYAPRCHASLEGIELGHINQKNESDMNLLNRLCEANGALLKIAGDYLMAIPRSLSENAAGSPIGEVIIDDPSDSSGRVTIQERGGKYGSVQASYFDEARQVQVNLVVEGEGLEGPTLELKGRHKDAREAQAKAEAKLQELQRGRAEMSLDISLRPEIMAQGKIRVMNHRQACNGLWIASRVTHKIGGGGTSSTSLQLTTIEHDATKSGMSDGRIRFSVKVIDNRTSRARNA